MTVRTVEQLRAEARRLRDLAPEGDDERLKAALLEVAEDFEWEAAQAEEATIGWQRRSGGK